MRTWMTPVGALICAGALVACGSPTGLDFNPAVFDPMPQLDELDFAAVQPAEDWDYWELREGGLTDAHGVIGSGGALAREELDPAALEALEAVRPPTGFSAGCLPAHCFKYVVAVDGDAVTVVDTAEELHDFLAPMTTAEEAILLVAALPLIWWDEGEDTGMRAIGGAWELVVFELARACAPVQTDRVLLRVDGSGTVTARGREVWRRLEGACV